MAGEGVLSSKAFLISSALLIGSGAAFIVYQHYMWTKKQRCLSAQIIQLKQQILKLENDIKQIREATTASSSTDEVEDIFVDASEVAQDMCTIPEHRESCESNSISEGHPNFSGVVMARLLARLDHQMDRGGYDNLKNANATFVELANKNPDNPNVQWRLAKSAFLLASEEMFNHPDSPNDGQRDLMQMAHTAATRAVQLDSESGDAHKWLAIIIGSVTQFLPIQEQIKNAFDIKEHIQAAIKYKPTDALAHHMLGRWCYSVYMLSWVERRVASTLFAEPPTATLEEAMDCFQKAEELKPKSSIDNALFLAKSYIAQQDYKAAVSWLKVGSSLPSSTRDDMKAMNEIKSLMEQYQNYDNS